MKKMIKSETNKRRTFLLGLGAALLMPGMHQASAATWTGGDGDWNVGTNWLGGSVPSGVEASVSGGGNFARILDPAPTLTGLTVSDDAAVLVESGGRIATPVVLNGGVLQVVGGTLGRNQANTVSRNSVQVGEGSELLLASGNILTSGVNGIAGIVTMTGGTWNHTSRFDLSGEFNISGGSLITGNSAFRDVGAATFRVTGAWGGNNAITLGAGGFQLTNAGSVLEGMFDESGGIETIVTTGDALLTNGTVRIGLAGDIDPGFNTGGLVGTHVLLAAAGSFTLDNVGMELGSSLLASGLSVGQWGVVAGVGDWAGYEVLQIEVIPEPATFALLLSGLALILLIVRRRA